MKLYAEATTFDEEALDNEFNKKRQNFTSKPVPPYSIGDLWTQGGSGDIMVCRVSRTYGEFTASDWEKASKYTDDSALSDWLSGDYADDIESIREQIDSKAETWYQSERPDITESWTAEEKQKHVGDLWYNTTANTTWRYDGTTWVQQNVPTEIFDAIDGKASIFTGAKQPSTASEGDLWFKSASDPIKTYVNGSWVEYNKYTDDSALDAFKEGDYADDIESLQLGISDAASKANNYISEIDEDGIFVHEEGQSASPSTGTGVHISDDVAIVRNGVRRTVLDDDGMTVKDKDGNDVAKFGREAIIGANRSSSDSFHQIKVTNTSVDFIENGSTIAYVSEDKGYFTNMEINDALYLKDYVIRMDNIGKLVIGRRR